MRGKCPEFVVLLAAAEGRLAPGQTSVWQEHLASCAACSLAIQELCGLQVALAELGRAEREAAPAGAWTAVAARLDRSRRIERLPLGVAALVRQARELLQPAIVGGAVAALAGLALGTWLAVTTQSVPSTAVASEPYTVSSLVADDATGFADTYLDGSDATASDDDHGVANDTTSSPDASSAPVDSPGGAR